MQQQAPMHFATGAGPMPMTAFPASAAPATLMGTANMRNGPMPGTSPWAAPGAQMFGRGAALPQRPASFPMPSSPFQAPYAGSMFGGFPQATQANYLPAMDDAWRAQQAAPISMPRQPSTAAYASANFTGFPQAAQ